MELSEDSKYRLAYLTLRLAFDRKLSAADPGAHPGLLGFLDAGVLEHHEQIRHAIRSRSLGG